RPDYFTTQVVDVTRQRAAEEARAANLKELEQRTKEVEVANAELGRAHTQVSDLMLMISHDVRQPLVAIKGFSEVMLDDWSKLSEAERLDFVFRIARAGETAEQMLEDSLTTTAMQGGGVVPQPTAVSLCAAARGVVDHLSTDRSGVTVSGPETLAAQVDRGHLVQVLTNLLTNAAKYGAPPIVVDCAPKGADHVVVRVTDQGKGIPADFVPQLFERYTRSESARSGVQRGTGLGLYIARTLIEANGGTIDYQLPAEGVAGFVVTLPAAKAN
ncbi:MAG: HAMP domain-containing sensor histidine kinase, partial [Nocardioides sp.]